MATSYQSKVASSSGEGTGAKMQNPRAMISNLGSVLTSSVPNGAVQSKVREVQKQRKAMDQLAEKPRRGRKSLTRNIMKRSSMIGEKSFYMK